VIAPEMEFQDVSPVYRWRGTIRSMAIWRMLMDTARSNCNLGGSLTEVGDNR